MFLFQYLDQLPSIPADLIKDPANFSNESHMWTAMSREVKTNNKPIKNLKYTRWELSDSLKHWVHANISNQIDQLGFQISAATDASSTHLCHTDSYPRKWVLNYIVDPGGQNVWTHFYKENNQPLIRDHLVRPTDMTQLEKLYSVKIEPGRWWLLNGLVLHDVTGVETQRCAVSGGIAASNPFNAINGYQGMLSL